MTIRTKKYGTVPVVDPGPDIARTLELVNASDGNVYEIHNRKTIGSVAIKTNMRWDV